MWFVLQQKRKRIRMVSDDEDSDKEEDADGQEAIATELFGHDDGEEEEGEIHAEQEETNAFEDLEASEEESGRCFFV